MARLPGIQDLGNAPALDEQRAVSRVDYSPVQRAAGSIARTGSALAAGGEALAKGVAQFGQGVGELGLDEQRWDYAKAKSFFLSGVLNQNQATGQATDYGPDDTGKSLVNRHADAVWKLQDQAAGMIGSGPMRERFMMETADDAQRSINQASTHARRLENNASIAWVGEQGTKLMNDAVTSADPEVKRQVIDSHGQLVDGLVAKGAITPVQGLGMRQTWAKEYATADLLHRADTDPEGVINELRAAPGSGDAITNRILQVEGGGKNSRSSATGTGQFIDSTWLDVLKRNRPDLAQGRSDAELLALRADKTLGRQMTDAYRQENAAYLQKQGVEATPGAQYLAHFLGPAGAAAVLKADANQPVGDVLTQAVGKDKAAAMVAANPTILQGQLAGSVKMWADGKMGGVTPGGGSIYDILRPDVKEQLIAHAQQQLDKRAVTDRASFGAAVQNATEEAFATGNVSKPLTLPDFVRHYGADKGPQRYQVYDVSVQTGRTVNAMATMTAEDRAAVVEGLAPKAGDPQYALKAKAYEVAQNAAKKIDDEIKADPARYAVTRLPASKEAFAGFQNVANGADGDRAAAAQHYAAVTLAEQGKVGVAADLQQVVPKGYADHVSALLQKSATSDDPNARVGLVDQVRREAAMWGQYWPQVMRQLAPAAQPVVRAIAAGADPNAMTRLLSIDPKADSPQKVLKEQNETKFTDLTRALNEEMAPFRQTLVGRQLDRDFPAYYGLAEKLGALYVRDGKSATDAARQAVTELVGGRYDFRDTYRIPKSAGTSPDAVQAGAQLARNQLEQLGAQPAVNDAGVSDVRGDSFSKFARDGRWVTSPNNDGLNLAYGDKFVRTTNGKPLLLTWAQLGELGKQHKAAAADMSGMVPTP